MLKAQVASRAIDGTVASRIFMESHERLNGVQVALRYWPRGLFATLLENYRAALHGGVDVDASKAAFTHDGACGGYTNDDGDVEEGVVGQLPPNAVAALRAAEAEAAAVDSRIAEGAVGAALAIVGGVAPRDGERDGADIDDVLDNVQLLRDGDANVNPPSDGRDALTKRPRLDAPSPKAAPARSAQSDCAVCLNAFAVGERFRALPQCEHVFHTACVATWLEQHPNCPICRADVVPLQLRAETGAMRRDLIPEDAIGRDGDETDHRGGNNRIRDIGDGVLPDSTQQMSIDGLRDSSNLGNDIGAADDHRGHCVGLQITGDDHTPQPGSSATNAVLDDLYNGGELAHVMDHVSVLRGSKHEEEVATRLASTATAGSADAALRPAQARGGGVRQRGAVVRPGARIIISRGSVHANTPAVDEARGNTATGEAAINSPDGVADADDSGGDDDGDADGGSEMQTHAPLPHSRASDGADMADIKGQLIGRDAVALATGVPTRASSLHSLSVEARSPDSTMCLGIVDDETHAAASNSRAQPFVHVANAGSCNVDTMHLLSDGVGDGDVPAAQSASALTRLVQVSSVIDAVVGNCAASDAEPTRQTTSNAVVLDNALLEWCMPIRPQQGSSTHPRAYVSAPPPGSVSESRSSSLQYAASGISARPTTSAAFARSTVEPTCTHVPVHSTCSCEVQLPRPAHEQQPAVLAGVPTTSPPPPNSQEAALLGRQSVKNPSCLKCGRRGGPPMCIG